MTVIHDNKGNSITEFPEVDGKRVVPIQISNQLVSEKYDYVEVFYPNDNITERYTFKYGGSLGTTVSVVTIVYTDSTKDKILNVTKV